MGKTLAKEHTKVIPSHRQDAQMHRMALASDIDRRNPLIEWSIYAGLLGVIIALFAGKFIFAAMTQDKSGLVLFITLVFIIACVKSFFDVLYVTQQLRMANSQLRALWVANNIKKFLENSESSLFRQHISNLYQIYVKDTNISQDNLIELLLAKLHGRIRIIDLASTILVTLGLIGTIVGLIASVAGLGLTVDNVGSDNEKMLEGMKETLGGMGTAFFTTLVGALFGGIALRILFSVVERHIGYLVTHIAELSEVHILPILRSGARQRENSQAGNMSSAPHRTSELSDEQDIQTFPAVD